MVAWTQQINKHTVTLPSGITPSMNGKIPDNLLSPVYRGDGKSFGKLSKPAARSWNAMVKQAIADGVPAASINATDAFRSYEIQVKIFKERYTTKVLQGRPSRVWNGVRYYQKPGTAAAAVPGTSNHGKASAVDKGDGSAFHAWLEKNANRFGWEWELGSEPWHLHYWPGDSIPQAVLDVEKGSAPAPTTGPPTPKDDDMKVLVKVKPDQDALLPEGIRGGAWWYCTATTRGWCPTEGNAFIAMYLNQITHNGTYKSGQFDIPRPFEVDAAWILEKRPEHPIDSDFRLAKIRAVPDSVPAK